MTRVSLHLISGVGAFAAALAAGVTALHFFEPHILFLADSLLPRLGPASLFLLVALNDFAVTPVSPDIAIFLIAHKWPGSYLLVFFLGLGSVCGGALAWACGRFLEAKFKPEALDAFVRRNHALINRYGAWIVALGALTPVPYSLSCWAAGALGMDFRRFLPMTLFRIPRFLLYYHFFSVSAGFAKTLQ